MRNRLFFFGSVSPRVVRRTNEHLFSNGTEPGSIDQEQTAWQGFGKVTYAAGRIHANASLLMTPTRSTGGMPAYDSTGTNFLTTSSAANEANRTRGFESDQNNVSANVDLTLGNSGYLSTRRLLLRQLQGHWCPLDHELHVSDVEHRHAGYPRACGSVNTRTRRVFRSPTSTRRRRASSSWITTTRSRAAHLIKGGWGVRRSVNDVGVAYPGGYTYCWGTVVPQHGHWADRHRHYGYYRVDDLARAARCRRTSRTCVQDTWTVGPRLTLNLGIRTENEKIDLPTRHRRVRVSVRLRRQARAALGATYDVRGDGRVKAFASWGRYYDWTKYEIARGSFGGDIWHIYYRSLDTLDIGSLNLNNMPGRDLWGRATGFRDLRATSINNTDPDIKPMFQDSFNGGMDFQMGGNMALGIHYIHNNLGRTIEDMGSLVNGDSVYVIGNPGEG